MKYMMAKVLYGAVGILLAAACICTGEKKLSQTDRQIYEKACSLEQEMEMLGFSGFSVRDYRVRYYDGDCDYVIAPSADTYTVTREKPKLDTFAGTIVKVGKEYQIVLPTYEKFKNFFAALDTAGSLQQQKEAGETVFALDSYSKETQATVIWHEAFHAWQQENGLDQAYALGQENREAIIKKYVDKNSVQKKAFTEEMKYLQNAYESTDMEIKKKQIKKALELQKKREVALSDKVSAAEGFLQNLEGSARYVECAAYRKLAGDEVWKKQFLQAFSYADGSGKYYDMGMYKCMLLDQCLPGWQTQFKTTPDLDGLPRLYIATCMGGIYYFEDWRDFMTVEEYRALLDTDFINVDIEQLTDIRNIKIDKNLSQEKRQAQFLKQVGNPYLLRRGSMIIKVSFANNGLSMEQAFENLLLNV